MPCQEDGREAKRNGKTLVREGKGKSRGIRCV